MAACKDVMASYVKQLLELDDSKRRATLESLSKYDFKDVDGGASPGSCRDSSDSMPLGSFLSATHHLPAPRKVMPSPALSKLEPAMIELPPGLGGPSKGLSAEAPSYLPAGSARADLEQAMGFWNHSMHLKQAAAAEWDGCARWGEATATLRESQEAPETAPMCPPHGPVPMGPQVDINISLSRVATPPVSRVQDGAADAAAQAARPEEKPQTSERLVGMLEKALSDLTNSLSPEAASEAQKVLGAVVEQANSVKPQGKCQDLEAMKWLAQHLEKQQEASVQKLVKLLGANGTTAMGGSPYAAGVVPGQPLPPPGLGAAAAVQRPMSWGHVEQQMAMQGCMADPSFMAMHGGCSPWWGPACAPMAPASPTRGPRQQLGACRRPMVPQGFAGGMQHQQHQQQHQQQQQQNLLAAENSDSSPGMQTGETLRMHLRSLIKIDSGRILIVRKINRLGFSSPELLEQHYSWYGTVERVLVAHSRVKSSALAGREAGNKLASRLRPSGLGFVVMSKPEEAEAILAVGQEQIVCGAVIRVQQFERRMSDMEDGNDNEELTPDTNSSEEQQSA